MAVYPNNAKVAASFTIEGSPGTNLTDRSMNYSNVLPNAKFQLNNPITIDELNDSSASSYRLVWNKVIKTIENSVFYSVINSEQLLLRKLNYIEFYNGTNPNPDGAYFPVQFNAYYTRGYNGTTPQAQYAYDPGSGYFSNIYNTDNPLPKTTINSVLSGSVNISNASTNVARIYFTNYGNGATYLGENDYVFDYDEFKLRLNIGNDYITASEMTVIKNNQDQTAIQAKILSHINGKVLKVYDEFKQQYEEMLITGFSGFGIIVNDDTRVCPNDLGYMPDNMLLTVVRGYNGTTPIDGVQNSVNISKGGHSYSNMIINAYVEQSSTTFYANPQDNMNLGSSSNSDNFKIANGSDNLTLNSNTNVKNLIKQTINEILRVNDNTNTLSYIKATLNEIIRLSGSSTYLSKTVLPVIINEFMVLRANSNRKAFFNQLINDTIVMFNNAMCYDYLTTFRFCNEFLIMKDYDVANIQAIGKILEVILHDFILFRDKNVIQTYYNQKVIDNVRLHDILSSHKNSLIVLSDDLTLNSYENNKAFFNVALTDYFRTSVLLNFNEELYEVYAINLENKALTRYDNYEFNSFASLKNKNYGMKKDGIYDLNDKTSNAELLLSSFKTGFLNSFSERDIQGGIDRLKQVKVAYFKIKNDGSSVMRVYKDDGEAFDYNVNANYNNGQQFRMQFGRDLSGSVFQIEFDNTGSFDLYDGKIEPIILKRRV